MRSEKPEERALVEKVGIIWPNQADRGTHINISGGGLLQNAPNRDAAVKFLEYLASDSAQTLFANGNNEWPIVKGAKLNNPGARIVGSIQNRFRCRWRTSANPKPPLSASPTKSAGNRSAYRADLISGAMTGAVAVR